MLILIGAICGAAYGAFIAKHRKGNRWDILHYACIYGLAFGLIGLFGSLILGRSMF